MLSNVLKMLKMFWVKKIVPNPLNITKTLPVEMINKHHPDIILYAFLSCHYGMLKLLLKEHKAIFGINITDINSHKKDATFFSMILIALGCMSLSFPLLLIKMFSLSAFFISLFIIILFTLVVESLVYCFLIKPVNDLIHSHLEKPKNINLKHSSLHTLISYTNNVNEYKNQKVYTMGFFKKLNYMFRCLPSNEFTYLKESKNPYKFIIKNWSFYTLKKLNESKDELFPGIDRYVKEQKTKIFTGIKNLMPVIFCLLTPLLMLAANFKDINIYILGGISSVIVLTCILYAVKYVKTGFNAKNDFINHVFKENPDKKSQFYALYENIELNKIIEQNLKNNDTPVIQKKRRL